MFKPKTALNKYLCFFCSCYGFRKVIDRLIAKSINTVFTDC